MSVSGHAGIQTSVGDTRCTHTLHSALSFPDIFLPDFGGPRLPGLEGGCWGGGGVKQGLTVLVVRV